MSKSISAALNTDIQRSVLTAAICVKITVKTGREYFITNHDRAITFDGQRYDHTIPFSLSAIDSGSQMAIDNTEFTLFCDEATFKKNDFRDGIFDHAECEIFFVDYESPSHGKMTMRRGWFGKFERDQKQLVRATVSGLMKILDFEVGRIYQPLCDADFGDARCKVAVRHEQAYSTYNRYYNGDWVYRYDPALMTALTVANPGFETGGVRSETQSISGWTKGTGAAFFVNSLNSSPTNGLIQAGHLPPEGTYALYGSADGSVDSNGFENVLYQDIDLVAQGVNTTHIDAGRIGAAYFALLSQSVYLQDPVKIRMQQLTAANVVVSNADSGWVTLDTINTWRERAVIQPVYPTTRKLRISIIFRKEDGAVANGAADGVRLFWFNHTVATPYDDAIYKLVRIVAFNDEAVFRPNNPSFEANGARANALNPVITSWNVTGWWQIQASLTPFVPTVGSWFLMGGDPGSGTSNVSTVTQDVQLSTAKLDSARQLLSKYIARFQTQIFFGDAGLSKATVKCDFYNALNVLVDSAILYNDTAPGAIGVDDAFVSFTLAPTATYCRFTLSCKSPISASRAKIAFDNVRLYFYDVEKPSRNDPISAAGSTATSWSPTVGTYTADGNLIWKALEPHSKYDVVSAVTDRKVFTATTMAGAGGTFETGLIWWISGANAGLKNQIRTWNSGTQQVKLYFRQPYDIQVGDRFIYVRSCQRRFNEDCVTVFQNGINFRGFPHLPGKLTEDKNFTI